MPGSLLNSSISRATGSAVGTRPAFTENLTESPRFQFPGWTSRPGTSGGTEAWSSDHQYLIPGRLHNLERLFYIIARLHKAGNLEAAGHGAQSLGSQLSRFVQRVVHS